MAESEIGFAQLGLASILKHNQLVVFSLARIRQRFPIRL
jgi:hypothetical protein